MFRDVSQNYYAVMVHSTALSSTQLNHSLNWEVGEEK